MSKVYLQKTRNHDDLYRLLNEVSPHVDSRRVFIKPNIVVAAHPKTAIVSNPSLARVVIDYFSRRGITDIVIGEAPGLLVDAEQAFEVSGFRKLARDYSITLLDLNQEKTIAYPWKYGKLRVPEIITESYYINMAKLKTHMNTTVTLGLKNQKGLLKAGYKKFIHKEGLHAPIAEIAKAITPNLTIIDGIGGVEGDGPLYSGHSIESDILIVSEDIVAADAVACRVMGIDPLQVEHIRLAAEADVGTIDPEVEGPPIDEVRLNFQRANEQYYRRFRFTNWRDPYACSMCGQGLEAAVKQIMSSPQKALRYGPKLAYYVLIGRLDIVSGRHATVPERHGKIICLGKCTKELAQTHNLIWIKGCPPQPEDVLEAFAKL